MNTYKEYINKLIRDSSYTFDNAKSRILDNKDIEIYCLLHSKHHTTDELIQLVTERRCIEDMIINDVN